MSDFDNIDAQGGQGPVEDDGWGDFEQDWGTPTQSDDFGGGSGQDDFAPQEFGQPQGSFIPQEDDGWGSTSGMEDHSMQATQNDFASSEANIQQSRFQPKQFKFSMKTVAFIILGVCIVAALLFVGLDKIHFTKKQPSQPNNPSPAQTQTSGNQGQQGGQQEQPGGTPSGGQVDTSNINSVTLVEIPPSTSLDYNGDVLTANGQVINKLKYVQGHQVLYCINVEVAFGSASQTISYYCNYSSFNAVKEGDIVILNYQQVNDTYISVVSISK